MYWKCNYEINTKNSGLRQKCTDFVIVENQYPWYTNQHTKPVPLVLYLSEKFTNQIAHFWMNPLLVRLRHVRTERHVIST